MALKHGKPNPLNYFDLRRVSFGAPHFKYIILERSSPLYMDQLNNWIYENLNNRYYIGRHLSLDNNNVIVYTTKVGFESEKELSFFTIACPYINIR
jgi:hypothetical protein